MIIKHWPDIHYTAVHKPDEYSLKQVSADFWVYEHMGYDGDTEAPLFYREGWDSSLDYTEKTDDAEIFLEGTIKWDGCSNWEFPHDIHFCGGEDRPVELGELFKRLYAWGRELGVDRLEDE